MIEMHAVDTSDLVHFAVLAALAAGYGAFSGRVERSWLAVVRSRSGTYVDGASVWTFAAAFLMPIHLMAVLVVVAYVSARLCVRAQPGSHSPRRAPIISFAVSLLAGVATAETVVLVRPAGLSDDLSVGLTLALAMAVFTVVTTVVRALALLVSGAGQGRLLGSWPELAVDVATLVLGAMTALSLLYAPWAVVLVLPALFLLQQQALLRQLVDAATTDVKTKLLNATAWGQVAAREVTRASQRGGSVAIVVLDMDNFKGINDEHGHLVGDAALRSVGAALAEELRGYDAVGRFGGEEFVAVLPGIDASAARHAAERLCRRIESLAVVLPGEDATVTVTASVGVALCPEHGACLDDLLRAADGAMYQAKRAGRNTVRVAMCAVPTTPRVPASAPTGELTEPGVIARRVLVS